MSNYRCAIIGCGGRAIWHAQAYRLVSRGSLAACCAVHPEKRETFAARFGLRAYASAAEMLEKEKPDLVHLVTWPESRVELMGLVDASGVPACIVEKPVACQVADWKELVELEQRTNTRFAICHQFRWHAAVDHCRQALRSGALGRLRFLDFTARFNISGQGTHILDYAMSLNEDAPVVSVFGAASGTQEMGSGHPGPDTTVAQVEFANGVWGRWSTGYASPKAIEEETPWKHVRVAAYAEKGRTLFEEFGQWEIVSPAGREGGQVRSMDEWARGNDEAQARMIEAMFDWLEDDTKPAGTNLKLGLHQWQAVLGLYASAAWSKPVAIPFDPPDDLFGQLGEALRGT